MHEQLQLDERRTPELLERTRQEALRYLENLRERPPAFGSLSATLGETKSLHPVARGASAAFDDFMARFGDHLPAISGPRYFGFVIGGALPAALVGDWLASIYDQNCFSYDGSAAPFVERETIARLRDLVDLPPDFDGTLTTGATMSNFVSLALAREWALQKSDSLSAAEHGLHTGGDKIALLGTTIHSSSSKSLAMLGIGRRAFVPVASIPGREAMDPLALEQALSEQAAVGRTSIVCASAGTVNTGDFDDLGAIAALKERFDFWLHVDGAFGGFVGLSADHKHLVQGLSTADSITLDAHKWLNVPHDCGIQLTRRRDLQMQVFSNSAAYLEDADPQRADYIHLTPENSRRFRALPLWFALEAYGREGYSEIITRNCRHARQLEGALQKGSAFQVLSPVYSNVVCFSPTHSDPDEADRLIARLKERGRAFVSKTTWLGQPALRAAFVNWRTTGDDVDFLVEELDTVAGENVRLTPAVT